MLQETFLPRLFFGKSEYITPLIGTLSTMPVGKSGLGLLNPVTSANEKYSSLQCVSTDFIRSMTWEGKFSNDYCLLVISE